MKSQPDLNAEEHLLYSLELLRNENLQLSRTLNELKHAIDWHSIAAITDKNGVILEVNNKFAAISKYTREELVGAPQNIVNSGHHSRAFWSELWRTISRGQVWQGELCNRAKDGSEYWVSTTILPVPGPDGRPDRYVSLRTDTTALHLADRRLRDLAYIDQLTKLPNRISLFEILEIAAKFRAEHYRVFMTVAVGDLHTLNHAFGFAEGDRLLIQTAQRLESMYPKPHTVARTDSSSFGIIFDDLGSDTAAAEARAAELAQQVIIEVGTTMRLGLGFSIDPSVRVGYTVFKYTDRLTGSEIFQQAEIALRRIPNTQRGESPSGYEPNMFIETQDRIKLVLDLRSAIAQNQMRMFLQPIVNAESEVVGFEGLVRWQHPELGLVLPGEFIPIAEQSGMIIDLGMWVLNEAARILGIWALHPATAHLTISVNVSERQLNPKTFATAVKSLLVTHGAPANRLKLEVTESLIHDDIDRSIEVLEAICAEGIEISLDDFGTGYSSLSYLVKLPVHQLKIDRSFIRPITENESGLAIVHAIVQLAHVMGLHVVAEGVETEEQFRALAELGVDAYQGYLFSEPLHQDALGYATR